MKKVLNGIKKLIIGIIALIYFTFVIIMTVLLLNYNDYGVTQFGTTNLILMRDNSVIEKYKKGDLILVESKKFEEIRVGEELFTYRLVGQNQVEIDIGTVSLLYDKDKSIGFQNGATYDMKFVAGSATKVYSGVGTYLSIIESKWGFLFMILVPCFMVFIYQLYSLIIEFKYGDEE